MRYRTGSGSSGGGITDTTNNDQARDGRGPAADAGPSGRHRVRLHEAERTGDPGGWKGGKHRQGGDNIGDDDQRGREDECPWDLAAITDFLVENRDRLQ